MPKTIPRLTEKANAMPADSHETTASHAPNADAATVAATPTKTPGQAAHPGQHGGFEKELVANVPPAGSDRPPQADLPNALSHGDKHYGENSDAAHHQRDAGYAADQQRHGLSRFSFPFDQGGLVLDREIVPLAFQPVTLAEHVPDFLLGSVEPVAPLRLDIDRLDVDHVHQSPHGRPEGHDDDVVLVQAVGVHALGLRHADNLERHTSSSNADVLADGVCFAEQIFNRSRAEHRHAAGSMVLLGVKEPPRRQSKVADGESFRGSFPGRWCWRSDLPIARRACCLLQEQQP